jgi:3-oxoacyl-[acyl-carrier-protein] synthase III
VLAAVRQASRPHLPADDLDTVERLLRGCFDACGTTVRYHRAPGEVPFELAARAGELALERAGLAPEDIDLLLYTGVCRAVVEPAAATAYQARLGLTRATAFDVMDACASWVRCLELAQHLTATGAYRRIMILNAEFGGRESHRYELHSLEEYLHWHPGVTVGEAATATIVTGSKHTPDFFETDFRTYGDRWRLCYVPLANADDYFGPDQAGEGVRPMQFVSHGMRLMEFATRRLVEHYRDRPQFAAFDADVVFAHSASDGMTRYVGEQCGIDPSRFLLGHHETANTVSASVPLAMSRALAAGQLQAGDRVLLLMASSGVTTALTKFVYQN